MGESQERDIGPGGDGRRFELLEDQVAEGREVRVDGSHRLPGPLGRAGRDDLHGRVGPQQAQQLGPRVPGGPEDGDGMGRGRHVCE